MAKRSSSELLDQAVEALMSDDADSIAADLDPRLTALLRIAADLRDLPSAEWKASLDEELRSVARTQAAPTAVPASYGKPLVTGTDIMARMAELAGPQDMIAFDLRLAMSDLDDRTMRFLAPLNQCIMGVSRLSSSSHWERHLGGDELLHLIDGEAEIVTLTDSGEVRSPFPAGSLFICPEGLWHRVEANGPSSLFFATPSGTEGSETRPFHAPAEKSAAVSGLTAHDIAGVLRSLPELRITQDTSRAQADAAFGELTTLNGSPISVGRFHGLSPWERHANGDELLYVLDGEVEVTVLTDSGPVRRTLGAGSVFVCPRGLWHRQLARDGATGLYATPKPTDVSFADDPRLEA